MVSLCVALAGCAVSRDYLQPKVDLPARWSEAQGTGLAAASADSPWWKAFNDPELNSLVDRALVANLDLQLAGERIRESRARGGVVGGLSPSVEASASMSRERDSRNAPAPVVVRRNGEVEDPARAENLFQAGFDARWEIDLFGGIRQGREAAQADYESLIFDRGAVILTLVAEVTRNYLELRGVQLQRRIIRDSLFARGENLALARARQTAGMTTEIDVARAEAEVESTAAKLPQLLAAEKKSVNRLAVLLGERSDALAAELAAEGALPVPAGEPPLGVPSDLLRRRPDIRSAERRVAAASARVGVATADLYPKFTLLGRIGLASETAGDFFNPASTLWSLGPSISWPIFQGGRVAANIEVRNAQLQQALIDYRRSILTAVEDVENAIAAYRGELVRQQLVAKGFAAQQLTETLVRERYAGGLVDFRDVLAAQRVVFDTQSELAQSELALRLDLVVLYKALGGGWNLPLPDARRREGERK
jgi:outer membrane protein, multidrug efflux system